MACPDNKPCGCEDTECGCAINANEIAYVGPTLTCTGIKNCDKLDDIITMFDTLLCSDEFIQMLINNILNNEDLYNQFVTIINDSINCETVQSCITTNTTCANTNLIINGGFDDDLTGWENTVDDDWIWSTYNGGSANYIGADEAGAIYQDILEDGITYDISFDLSMNAAHVGCDNYYIIVYAGDTESPPIRIFGTQQINLIMTCVGSTIFAIQGLEDCSGVIETIFIDNVVVTEHCDNFTTTSTTTTTAILTTTTTTTGEPFYKLNLDDFTYGSLALACAGSFSVDLDLYSETFDLNVGDFVYLDEALTMPYDGSSKIFQLRKLDLSFVAVQISSAGEILSLLVC